MALIQFRVIMHHQPDSMIPFVIVLKEIQISRLQTVDFSDQKAPTLQKQSLQIHFNNERNEYQHELCSWPVCFLVFNLNNCVSSGKPQNNLHSLVRKNEEEERSYNRPKQRYCGFGWVAVFLGYFGQVENPSYPSFFHTPNFTVESATKVSKLLSTQKFLFKCKYEKQKQWKSLFTILKKPIPWKFNTNLMTGISLVYMGQLIHISRLITQSEVDIETIFQIIKILKLTIKFS